MLLHCILKRGGEGVVKNDEKGGGMMEGGWSSRRGSGGE